MSYASTKSLNSQRVPINVFDELIKKILCTEIDVRFRVSAMTWDAVGLWFRRHPSPNQRTGHIKSPPLSLVPIGRTKRRSKDGHISASPRNPLHSSYRTSVTRTRPCTSVGSISKSHPPEIPKSIWPSYVSTTIEQIILCSLVHLSTFPHNSQQIILWNCNHYRSCIFLNV